MQLWKLIREFDVLENFGKELLVTHAQLPTPFLISPECVRIYFATRDNRQYSSIFFVDLQYSPTNREFNWLPFSPQPVLSPGEIGTFDEHGVYPSSIVKIDDLFYLYYIGWNKGTTPPLFYSSIGLATSLDGVNYSKISNGPILARNRYEPYLVTSPFVERINERYKMHFVSGNGWICSSKGLESRYDIKSIESSSLTDWSSESRRTVIALRNEETNIARPWIVEENGYRLMYFSFLRRGSTGYQIGIAREVGPGSWLRLENELDFQGLHTIESMAYPVVVQVGSEKIMLLNGDDFGKKGFYVFQLQAQKSDPR